jgi:hypothetical protein
MKKRKTLKIVLLSILAIALIGGAYVIYLFNMPHRDVVNAESDYQVKASTIVSEYLSNPVKANEKYLDEEGDSKIFEVSGTIKEVSEDFEGQTVVLLQGAQDKAGVSCTFTKETKKQAGSLKPGQDATIKGVIRAGASYDADLEMYENVILEKCSLIK